MIECNEAPMGEDDRMGMDLDPVVQEGHEPWTTDITGQWVHARMDSPWGPWWYTQVGIWCNGGEAMHQCPVPA